MDCLAVYGSKIDAGPGVTHALLEIFGVLGACCSNPVCCRNKAKQSSEAIDWAVWQTLD